MLLCTIVHPPPFALLPSHSTPPHNQLIIFFLKPWLALKALVAERLKKEERLLEMLREKEVRLLRLRFVHLAASSRSL